MKLSSLVIHIPIIMGNKILHLKIFSFIMIFTLSACKNASTTSSDNFSKPITNNITIDTTDTQLYDFVEAVIKKEKLPPCYELNNKPLHWDTWQLSLPQASFLKRFFLKDSSIFKQNKNTNLKSPEQLLQEHLNINDVDFMLSQKEKDSDFNWDWSKLKIKNISPLESYTCKYSFAIPLFSKDGNTAIIVFDSSLGGKTLIGIKENNEWIIEDYGIHVH